jgi:hypothetical protein
MPLYAVRKRHGAWTICDDQKPLMLLDSYEEAVEVANAAAAIRIEAGSAARCGAPHDLKPIECQD